MNENIFVDSLFFRSDLFLSHGFFCFFCLHFCLLSHFEIIRCIVKSLFDTSMYFLLKYNWKKVNLKSVFWAPDFGHPNLYTVLPNSLNTSLVFSRVVAIILFKTFATLSFSAKFLNFWKKNFLLYQVLWPPALFFPKGNSKSKILLVKIFDL